MLTVWAEDTNIQAWLISVTRTSNSAAVAKEAHSITLLTVWTIWKKRNNRVCRQGNTNMERLLSQVEDEAMKWILTGVSSGRETQPWSVCYHKWSVRGEGLRRNALVVLSHERYNC
jgi:hypothetical protein